MHLELVDNSEIKVYIRDRKHFHRHILPFQYQGTSIHFENEHYFTVDDTYLEKLENLIQASKKD